MREPESDAEHSPGESGPEADSEASPVRQVTPELLATQPGIPVTVLDTPDLEEPGTGSVSTEPAAVAASISTAPFPTPTAAPAPIPAESSTTPRGETAPSTNTPSGSAATPRHRPSPKPRLTQPSAVQQGRAPGGMIAERYRLLAQVGADQSVHAEFWRARDTVLERDVSLTLLQDTGEPGGSERAAELISRALRWGQFEDIGCARLLDVMRNDSNVPGGLPDDIHGLAVTEWVPGKSLAEAVANGPLRTSAVLSMLDPLAQGAEAAHRQGLVLGCAHPQRVRITPEGGARLAFALPHPDVTPADDVHGLGATLYSLLTAHWPLSGTDAELAGLPPAPRDVQDDVLPPGVVRPGVSVEVSALALGALGSGGPHGRVHTAAAVHKVISELLDAESEAAMLPPPDDGAPMAADEVWRTDSVDAPAPDRVKKRKLSIGMGGLGLGMLAVIAYVGVQLGSLLGVTPPSAPKIVVGNPPAAAATAPAAPRPSRPTMPTPELPPGSAAVQVATARVFDLTGDPDNPGRVAKALDDDPTSSWSTYNYRQPFPVLKTGVGIMVSFASPVQLSSLVVTSPSVGTKIEIRSAPTPDATFNQTIPITDAELKQTLTTVSLAGSQPVQNVLVWITKLGGVGDQNVTEFSDLRFERVTG